MKRRLLRGEQGASTVEFAIIAVVLFAILFGIIEFGILMFDKHILTNASREGARAGIVMKVPRVSDATIIATVEKYAKSHMVSFGSSSTLITTVTPPVGSRNAFGTELVVNATYPYKFMYLSGLGLGPITLKAETRMRME